MNLFEWMKSWFRFTRSKSSRARDEVQIIKNKNDDTIVLNRHARVSYEILKGIHVKTGYQIPGQEALIPKSKIHFSPDSKFHKGNKTYYRIPIDENERITELLEMESYFISPRARAQKSSQENDAIIVKSLKEYEIENYVLPILLTADEAITDICELHGLEYFLLKYPSEFKLSGCTFKQLDKLVLNLAGVMGFIKVNSVIIFGEFKGKRTPDDYLIRFLDTKKQKTMKQHLQICRKLIDLDISI